jgi:hypothetical protein
LVVEYRWSPPATVERRRFAGELEVSDVLVDDTAAMAHCGYVQVEHAYVRAAGASGDLVLRYRYDPVVAGEPIGPLPTAHGDPRGVWWVLWPDAAAPVVDGEAGTLEHVVRTAVTRGLSAVRRSRPHQTPASGEP